MSKNVVIEVTHRRNFTFGSRIFGAGGRYEVDAELGKQLADTGKVKVVKGELPKEAPVFTSNQSRQSFLNMIRSLAPEINAILQNETRQVPSGESEAPEKVPEEEASGEDEEDDESEEAPKVEETLEGDNKGKQQNDSGTPLPETFPARKELEAAGLTILEAIPQDKEALRALGLSTRQINAVAMRLQKEGK